MVRKNFKITCSLKEGYAPGAKRHRVGTAEKCIAAWMKQRLQSGEPGLSGFLQEGKLLFPAKEAVIVEPTVIFEGELSSPEDLERTDKEVKTTLNSLAAELKDRLNQESVFVSYRDRHWCV